MRQEVPEIQVSPVRQEKLEQPVQWESVDHQDLRACRDSLDHQEYQECLASRETEGYQETRDHREIQVLLEDLESQDLLD